MSRYHFDLNTQKRTYTVTDLQLQGKLIFEQKCDDQYFDNDNESDRLVEFANEFQQDIADSRMGLDLRGENRIIFDNNDFPVLSGGLRFHDCMLPDGHYHNSTMERFRVIDAHDINVSHSTISDLTLYIDAKYHFSHCFINADVHPFKDGFRVDRYEFLMNKDVTGTMW